MTSSPHTAKPQTEYGVDWTDRAACRGHHALFFPPDHEYKRARERREAACKAICANCEVIDACRAEAMSDSRAFFDMVAAGMTFAERRQAMGYKLRSPGSIR